MSVKSGQNPFEALVEEIQQDYAMNERKSVRRVNDYIIHLTSYFSHMRATSITTDKIKGYITKRREA